MSRRVSVRINKQQAEVLDRMVARGEHGEARAEVIRKGLREFVRGERPPPREGDGGSKADGG
jgi:Arc/MetJ-type ribon-helix-helix transcriptional regulator